jgi:hypothetical protein
MLVEASSLVEPLPWFSHTPAQILAHTWYLEDLVSSGLVGSLGPGTTEDLAVRNLVALEVRLMTRRYQSVVLWLVIDETIASLFFSHCPRQHYCS